jgi:predicted alpha/beta-fold hydrolase
MQDVVVDIDIDNLQVKAAPIASSFQSGNFDPWITNCHVQTIGGFFVRRICPYVPSTGNTAWFVAQALAKAKKASDDNKEKEDSFWDHRERIETPDGDWFHADTKYVGGSSDETTTTAPTVILLHGLESNSNSTLSTEMAQSYLAKGMNCVCLNFRGCSGEPNSRPGGYHLGFTDDLKHYLQLVRERASSGNNSTSSRLYLAGFSLGANVVLKCLGELGASAVDYNIHGAAVSCAPLDQQRNSAKLALPGINRIIYTNKLLEGLKARAVVQLERFCDGNEATDRFDYPGAMAAKTITEFDEAFIAPVYGFSSAFDYYEKTSSTYFLERITVPTMILNAKDDPFLDEAHWPTEKTRDEGGKAPIKMVRTEHGGHLGFCWHRVADEDINMMTLQQQQDPDQPTPPSWASAEQARFLAHVDCHPDTAQLG